MSDSFAWVHNDSWLYSMGNEPSTLTLRQVQKQGGISADFEVQTAETDSGLLWHHIIVHRLSLKLIRLLVAKMRQGVFRCTAARRHRLTLDLPVAGTQERAR